MCSSIFFIISVITTNTIQPSSISYTYHSTHKPKTTEIFDKLGKMLKVKVIIINWFDIIRLKRDHTTVDRGQKGKKIVNLIFLFYLFKAIIIKKDNAKPTDKMMIVEWNRRTRVSIIILMAIKIHQYFLFWCFFLLLLYHIIISLTIWTIHTSSQRKQRNESIKIWHLS